MLVQSLQKNAKVINRYKEAKKFGMVDYFFKNTILVQEPHDEGFIINSRFFNKDNKKIVDNCNHCDRIKREIIYRIDIAFNLINEENNSLGNITEKLELLYSNFTNNYNNNPKPYYGNNFINKLKHFITNKK